MLQGVGAFFIYSYYVPWDLLGMEFGGELEQAIDYSSNPIDAYQVFSSSTLFISSYSSTPLVSTCANFCEVSHGLIPTSRAFCGSMPRGHKNMLGSWIPYFLGGVW